MKYAEEADRGSWNIDEATNKFKSSLGGNLWKTALKSGVKLDANVLERHICDKTPDEYVNYAARYELAFVTPCGYQVILKVRFKIHFVTYTCIAFFANTLSFFIRSACHFAAGIKDGRIFGPDAKTLTRHPRLSVRVKELTISIYGMYASEVFHIVWRQKLVRSTFHQ